MLHGVVNRFDNHLAVRIGPLRRAAHEEGAPAPRSRKLFKHRHVCEQVDCGYTRLQLEFQFEPYVEPCGEDVAFPDPGSALKKGSSATRRTPTQRFRPTT